MNDNAQALTPIVTGTSLDLAVSAWLHAHGLHFNEEGKPEHTRTSKAYDETMKHFQAELHKVNLELDADPTQIALVAQAFAYSPAKGKPARKSTINHRLACISSFYRYARKMKLYTGDNPIELMDREKVQSYAQAEALPEERVKEALASIDQSTPRGARDYAILSVLFQTARRAQEVATLQWRHVKINKGKATLTFEHTKGDEVMRDELPVPVTNALLRWLHAYYGAKLGKLAPDAPLWVSLAHDESYGQALGYQSINALCKKHLDISRVHVTRHSAAHAMEKLGLTVSEIQARLGHKSLATTGRYLASLKREENRKADELAALYGIE